MTDQYQQALKNITQVHGVRGALVVTQDDGLVVADSLVEGVRGNAVAALTASLVKRMGLAAQAACGGAQQFLHLQARDGAVFVMPTSGDVVIVAIADQHVDIGLVRLEMAHMAQAVA